MVFTPSRESGSTPSFLELLEASYEQRNLVHLPAGSRVPLLKKSVWLVVRGMVKLSSISIQGDELLLGLTANGHLTFIGSQLGRRGVLLQRNVTITDEADAIVRQFRESWAASDVVITTGGLGPTCDDRTREALAGLEKAGPPDACHGHKLRYVNPASGGAPIATMGTFMQLLPKGFATSPYRSTDGTVFSVVEGEGESTIGDRTFRWKKRDHFVVPSWAKVVHKAASETVLFSFSDRPVQERLDLWREDRGGK